MRLKVNSRSSKLASELLHVCMISCSIDRMSDTNEQTTVSRFSVSRFSVLTNPDGILEMCHQEPDEDKA